jgi:hypothetical protein
MFSGVKDEQMESELKTLFDKKEFTPNAKLRADQLSQKYRSLQTQMAQTSRFFRRLSAA